MNVSTYISSALAAIVLLFSTPALAQDAPGSTETPPTAQPGEVEAPPAGGSERDKPTRMPPSGSVDEPAETWSATAQVTHGVTGEPITGTGVVLKASRPKGPFEPTEPKPFDTWEGVTNAEGRVTFDGLPDKVKSKGLELYAVTTHNGIEFKSGRSPAGEGASLNVEVYPRAADAESVRTERIRVVAEPWEDFLVVTQFWQLTVDGENAVDTEMLAGEKFEKGLPLALPLDAKGIHASGPGKTKVVDSTVHWKGVLRPGETVALRLRFSMPASGPEFVFRQSVDYPTSEVEVLLPLQSEHQKVGRLDEAALAAKGFEKVTATTDVPDFRRDREYLYARGKSLSPGESFAVQFSGLPFERPIGPWLALGLGLLGMGLIIGYARRDQKHFSSEETRRAGIEALEREREQLLDELAELEQSWEDGEIGEVTYETESLHLRERLSLVMKKLDELRQT